MRCRDSCRRSPRPALMHVNRGQPAADRGRVAPRLNRWRRSLRRCLAPRAPSGGSAGCSRPASRNAGSDDVPGRTRSGRRRTPSPGTAPPRHRGIPPPVRTIAPHSRARSRCTPHLPAACAAALALPHGGPSWPATNSRHGRRRRRGISARRDRCCDGSLGIQAAGQGNRSRDIDQPAQFALTQRAPGQSGQVRRLGRVWPRGRPAAATAAAIPLRHLPPRGDRATYRDPSGAARRDRRCARARTIAMIQINRATRARLGAPGSR